MRLSEFLGFQLLKLCLQGFDEYMNLVLDDAYEVYRKKNTRTPLGICLYILKVFDLTDFFNHFEGRILLKGDNITLMQSAGASA